MCFKSSISSSAILTTALILHTRPGLWRMFCTETADWRDMVPDHTLLSFLAPAV